MQTAMSVCEGPAHVEIGSHIVLNGLSVALPEPQATRVCHGQRCQECFLWDPCIQGVLPFGWLVDVTIQKYHLRKSLEYQGNYAPKLGKRIPRIVTWGKLRPKEILSFNKALYLPQTFKTDDEKAFIHESDTDYEE